jgi:hypothetical protein
VTATPDADARALTGVTTPPVVPPPITCKLPVPRSSPSAVGNSRTQSLNLFVVTFRNSLPYESGFGSNE